LAEIGQAVSQAGDVAGHLFEQEMSGRVSGAESQATRALHDLLLEVESDPDHNSRTARYAKGSSEIAARFRESIGYPKFQQDFDLRFEGTLEHGRMKVAHGVRQASLASSRANRLLAIETYHDAIKKEPDPVEKRKLLDKVYEEIRLGVEGGLWDEEAAAKARIQADNRFEGETLITHSQSLSDEIWDNHTTQKARLSEARTLSGELRTLVTGLLKQRKTEEDGFDAEATNEDLTVLIRAAQPGGIYTPTQKPLTQVDLDVEVLRRKIEGRPMDSRNVATISNIIAQRDANAVPEGAFSTYLLLMDQAANPGTRPQFMATNLLSEYGDKLSAEQLAALHREQANGPNKGYSPYPKMLSDRAELIHPGKTEADYEKRENFKAVVHETKLRMERERGHPLEFDAIRDLIDAMADKVVLEEISFLPDKERRGYEIAQDWQQGIDVPFGMPDKETEAAIRQVLFEDEEIPSLDDDSEATLNLIRQRHMDIIGDKLGVGVR
jgi:hypothetical protein